MIQFIIRVALMLIMAPLLIPVTLYARLKNLERLPWGFEYISGNREDNWDGKGGAKVKRKLWLFDGTVDIENGTHGWWQQYLYGKGVVWDSLGFLRRWWYSYKWCAIRNPAWNVRYIPWLSTSCNKPDVRMFQNAGNCEAVDKTSDVNLRYDFTFTNADGNFTGHYRHTKIFGKYYLSRRWGWKVYPSLFKLSKTPLFKQRSVSVINFEIVNIEKQ
jgi:hypothetical protein